MVGKIKHHKGFCAALVVELLGVCQASGPKAWQTIEVGHILFGHHAVGRFGCGYNTGGVAQVGKHGNQAVHNWISRVDGLRKSDDSQLFSIALEQGSCQGRRCC